MFTTVVNAAPPCWPDIPPFMSPQSYRIETPGDKLPVGAVIFSASTVGLVWGYTCIDTDGKWWKVIAGGAWSEFPADWFYILDQAIRGDVNVRTQLWNKYATATEWDPRLKPDLDTIWAKLPSPPPFSVWKVVPDPFRADKKRLVYNVANGKRGTPTTQYVDAGTPCDPVTTITEFGPVYFMSVLGNPNLVARCAK